MLSQQQQREVSFYFVLITDIVNGNNQPTTNHRFTAIIQINLTLQCFDAVGWAAGRASGL